MIRPALKPAAFIAFLIIYRNFFNRAFSTDVRDAVVCTGRIIVTWAENVFQKNSLAFARTGPGRRRQECSVRREPLAAPASARSQVLAPCLEDCDRRHGSRHRWCRDALRPGKDRQLQRRDIDKSGLLAAARPQDREYASVALYGSGDGMTRLVAFVLCGTQPKTLASSVSNRPVNHTKLLDIEWCNIYTA